MDDTKVFCRICKVEKPTSQMSPKSRVCKECVPAEGRRKVAKVVEKYERIEKARQKRVAEERRRKRESGWEPLGDAADSLEVPLDKLKGSLHKEGYMEKVLSSYTFHKGRWVEKRKLIPSDKAFFERVCRRTGRKPSGNRTWSCKWSMDFLRTFLSGVEL